MAVIPFIMDGSMLLHSPWIIQDATPKIVDSLLMLCWRISKKHLRLGGMAPSGWMLYMRGVRDTPVADYSVPGVNTTRRVAYRPLIGVSSRSVGLLF
jgi:hypothetical protein